MSKSQTTDIQYRYEVITKQFLKVVLSLFSISLLTLLFTFNLQYNGVGIIIRNTTGTTNVQTATGEAIFMTISALVGASIILFLLLRHKFTLIYLLFVSSISIVMFVMFELHLSSLITIFDNIDENVLLFISFLFSIIMIYSIFINKNTNINTIGLMLFISMTGSTLGIMFTDVQITLILLMLSLYDIFTVTKGPLKKIVTKMNEIETKTIKENILNPNYISSQGKKIPAENKLGFRRGMFLTIGHVEFGIGDLLFYSAILSNALTIAFLAYLITLIGIIIGVEATLYLLTRRELVPGLPIPSLIGLIALWITKLFLL